MESWDWRASTYKRRRSECRAKTVWIKRRKGKRRQKRKTGKRWHKAKWVNRKENEKYLEARQSTKTDNLRLSSSIFIDIDLVLKKSLFLWVYVLHFTKVIRKANANKMKIETITTALWRKNNNNNHNYMNDNSCDHGYPFSFAYNIYIYNMYTMMRAFDLYSKNY